MQQLHGRDAQVATLRAGLSISSLRAKHAPTKAIREEHAALAADYARRLRAMGLS